MDQLNKRFSIHPQQQPEGQYSPHRTVSASMDSTNLKDVPPFNKKLALDTQPTSGSTDGGRIDTTFGDQR